MDNEGILGVDIECTECGRLMALSNAFQYDHKYLCPRCAPTLDQLLSVDIKDEMESEWNKIRQM